MRATGPSRKTRRLVIDRDGGVCRMCGRAGTNVHHRRPRGMGGTRDPETNSPANLVLLCGSGTTGCHGWIESHRAEAMAAGWLVSKWADPSTTPIKTSRGVIRLTDHGTIITIGEKDG